MQTSVLDAKHFHDEEAAYAYLEARIWPNGPVCPHCGGVERISKMGGKSTRIGVYKCYQCRKPFRVTVGTVFESIACTVRLWLQCVHLMASSKKGISSNQLHRTLGVTLKDRVVHVASRARSHEGAWHGADGRRWQDRRGRRNLYRSHRRNAEGRGGAATSMPC